MAKIRARAETGKLFYDFTYLGIRCREQTLLDDTKQNRKRLEATLTKISAEIALECLSFEKYFPNSTNLPKVKQAEQAQKQAIQAQQRRRQGLDPHIPTLSDFTEVWLAENEVRWRKSTRVFMHRHAYQFIVPEFGERVVSEITRAEILAFRSKLAKVPARTAKGVLSARTINAHMMVLKTLLSEARVCRILCNRDFGYCRGSLSA